MLDIIILSVGKIKESYFQEAFDEYLKRLKPYAKIGLHELKPEPFMGDSDKEKSKKIEGERILNFLDKHQNSEVVILDEHGKKFSSVKFSEYLMSMDRQIIFVVGGALGFSEEVSEKHKNKISLSDMTFPHEMARVLLIEQIYRATAISKGKSYHY